MTLLNPQVDGVILSDTGRKATFLPQVWEQLPEPDEFLSHLCQKMGAPSDLWRKKLFQVSIYQVEKIEESE
jgi:AMMECR1 domain-containing protein